MDCINIGSEIPDDYKGIFLLDIKNYFEKLDPPERFDLEIIDPGMYFVTSGDAIEKTEYLSKILWSYAGTARSQLNNLENITDNEIAFEKLCWSQAGKTNKLMNDFIKARGDAVFLETEWTDEGLLLKPKNPRSKK